MWCALGQRCQCKEGSSVSVVVILRPVVVRKRKLCSEEPERRATAHKSAFLTTKQHCDMVHFVKLFSFKQYHKMLRLTLRMLLLWYLHFVLRVGAESTVKQSNRPWHWIGVSIGSWPKYLKGLCWNGIGTTLLTQVWILKERELQLKGFLKLTFWKCVTFPIVLFCSSVTKTQPRVTSRTKRKDTDSNHRK